MKLMIFYNQEKSAYVATISKKSSYTLYKRGKARAKKEEVGSLVKGKESHFKRRFGSVVCRLMV